MIEQSSAIAKALAAATLVGLGTVLLGGCSAKTEAAAQAPVAIAIAPAEPPGSSSVWTGAATAAATHTYRVGFEIGGRVTQVNADVGDRVSEGSTLATIDPADAQAQLDTARARAASAHAALLKAQNGARPQEQGEAQAAVEAAKANVARVQAALSLAQANDHRMRSLLVEGDVSQQQADNARTALLDAQGQLNAAQAQLMQAEEGASLVLAGTRDEDKRLARADSDAADAAVALAEASLRKTAIHAPRDAYVQSRALEPGDQSTPGAPAFVLVDAAPSDVLVDVPEVRANLIRTSMDAVVREGARTYRGSVTRVEPSAEGVSHTVRVRVAVPGLRLRPGSVVAVAIGEHPQTGARVPASALLRTADGATVLVYDANNTTVRRRPVDVVDAQGESVVVHGVHAGEPIVIAGQYAARPGTPVRIASGS